MLLRNLQRRSPSNRLIAGTPYIGLLAAQIISETATGDHGAGLLYNEALAQTGRQLRVKVTGWSGTAGTLFVYENGSVLVAESQADGAFAIGYDWEAWADDGSLITGSDTASVTIGPQSATAPGASVTGSGTISAGSASGQQNATAPGASVTGSGTVTAGDASGGVAGDAAAPGATLSGTGTVNAGSASGQQNATAPGASVTGSGTITAGQAGGDADGTAPGANVTGGGSVAAGGAGSATLISHPRFIIKAKARDYVIRR